MRFANIAGTAAFCLFSGLIVPGYAQHDEKRGERQGGKPEQRAQPAQQEHAQQPQQQQRTQQAQPQPQRAQQTPQQRVQAPQQQRQERPQQRAEQPQQQQRAEQPQQQQRAPQAQQRPQRAEQAPQQRTQAPQQRAQQQQQQPQRSRQQAQSWQQQRGWLKQGGGWQGHDTFQQDGSRNWASDHRSWAQRGGYGGYYIPQYSFNLYFGDRHFFRLAGLPVMYLGYPRFEYQGISFLMLDPWPESWSQDWYASDDVYIDYDDGYYLYDRNYPQQRLAITILV